MIDTLELGSLTESMKVIDAIREKWDKPPEEGSENLWWYRTASHQCALCHHMQKINRVGAFCIPCEGEFLCPFDDGSDDNDEYTVCSTEYNLLKLFMEDDSDSPPNRARFLELFTAMRDRVFALKVEDIPCIVDSNHPKDE